MVWRRELASKMGIFDGQVAVVTASTAGIGKAIAERFAKDGAHVVVSSRKQKNVDQVVKEFKDAGYSVSGCACHVSKEEDRAKLIDFSINAFPGCQQIDILVSNAAVSPSPGPLDAMSEEMWDKLFSVNVKSAGLLVGQAQPYMKDGGSIVFVSSIAGYNPSAPLAGYGVTKTALFGLTKGLAAELGASKKIRVNCVAPGVIRTRFSRMLWENEQVLEEVNKGCVLSRIGEPEEIAGPVVFLCSKDASYITGETLLVAGGKGAARL
uniref:Dehydrogenase/reductase SDR family member 4 n=1 Tax=Paramoeba aestuarina TaxID=180227 RepID=A0A7S4PMV4_9EUKA